MKQFIDSITISLGIKNWYVALFTSLCMPDICGKIEYPEERSSSNRYVKWYEKYLIKKYSIDHSFRIPQLQRVLNIPNISTITKIDKNMQIKLRKELEELKHNPMFVTLSGEDCYAIRCSFLHEGDDNISEQRISDSLSKFRFTTDGRLSGHNNFSISPSSRTIQLQVDIFCNDVLEGVNSWLNDIKDDSTKMNKMNNLLKIQSMSSETI